MAETVNQETTQSSAAGEQQTERTFTQPDMVTVRFGSVEKKFLLPAAIVQGYLSLMEN